MKSSYQRGPHKVPLLKKLQFTKEHTGQTGLKRNRATFCRLMKARLFFLGLGATDSLDNPPNTEFKALYLVKHGSASIMIWG